MKLHYDKKADALYLRFNDNRYSESNEIDDGIIFDYDDKGKIIGIEILNASGKMPVQFRDDMSQSKLPLTFSIEPDAQIAQ